MTASPFTEPGPPPPWEVGVHGKLAPRTIGELARLSEELGYGGFWFNVVGTEVDPVARLASAYASTRRMEIGVGVIPLDTHPAEVWAPKMAAEELDSSRVTVGVGAGAAARGQLRLVGAAIDVIRKELPHTRVGVGTKGPRMLELSARSADAVIFSMLTPAEVRAAVAKLQTTTTNPGFFTHVYHRVVATGPEAERQLLEEMAANGVDVTSTRSGSPPPLLGSISDGAADLAMQLDHWGNPAPARIILRPVVDWNDIGEVRAVLARLSPREVATA
ncbi:LLM class flavin-dependent oxidoreductase [Mycolicibacterium stellerae]|uniref:LLM class flavin-dependent oxidoreductase n=1 Tax=Mycolicibacterium stellerae TaxID=2358193 RepID=UPI000F0B92A1|nr:LLM class flavin-dependent oxidoreductase [Mycolicibacterium stellerae]